MYAVPVAERWQLAPALNAVVGVNASARLCGVAEPVDPGLAVMVVLFVVAQSPALKVDAADVSI